MNDLMSLVLCGGYSTRMGSDKSLLNVDGVPLFQRAVNLLRPFTDQVFISCRADQEENYLPTTCLIDHYADIGPMGGIATALEMYPGTAFLVLAVDLVTMNSETLDHLISHRDSTQDTTCFQRPSQQVEPLCTIYEPTIYPLIKENISDSDFSLSKVIKMSQACYLPIYDFHSWTNWNE